MSTVFHRTTLERRGNVSAASFDPGVWLADPDLTPVAGVPDEYWKIVGDSVVEMAPAEKAAQDAQLLADAKKARLYEFETKAIGYTAEHYDQSAQTMLLALVDEAKRLAPPLVNREAYIQPALNWVKTAVGYYIQKGQEVMAQGTIAAVQAVVYDLAQFDASDPGVTVPGALSIPD